MKKSNIQITALIFGLFSALISCLFVFLINSGHILRILNSDEKQILVFVLTFLFTASFVWLYQKSFAPKLIIFKNRIIAFLLFSGIHAMIVLIYELITLDYLRNESIDVFLIKYIVNLVLVLIINSLIWNIVTKKEIKSDSAEIDN